VSFSACLTGAALLVVLSGCGVTGQGTPQPVPSDELPRSRQPAVEEPSSTALPATVTVYLVGDRGRLAAQTLAASADSPLAALDRLLLVEGPQDGLRSAVPPGTRVRSARLSGATLTIDLTEQLSSARGQGQLLALAQIVWTATEYDQVDQVRIAVEGSLIELPVDRGGTTATPVDRDDYDAWGPAP
jgi:spore germination protein GerM